MVAFEFALFVAVFLLLDVATATLYIPSYNGNNKHDTIASYQSIPALYYGQPWFSSDGSVVKNVTVHLKYYKDADDWCTEYESASSPTPPPPTTATTTTTGGRLPRSSGNTIPLPDDDDDDGHSQINVGSWSEESLHPPQLSSPTEDYPIALLLYDKLRVLERGYYKCQLVDYENMAKTLNVSYIIFYDAIPDRPLAYIRDYLDSPIITNSTSQVGFQLVSHTTGTGKLFVVCSCKRKLPYPGKRKWFRDQSI